MGRGRKKNKNSVNYIENKEMMEELRISNKNGRCTEKLGKMFHDLTNRIASRPNFAGYTFIDEMINEGIVRCLNAWPKFNMVDYDKPFAFFSQCIFYAYINTITTFNTKYEKLQEYKDIEYEKLVVKSGFEFDSKMIKDEKQNGTNVKETFKNDFFNNTSDVKSIDPKTGKVLKIYTIKMCTKCSDTFDMDKMEEYESCLYCKKCIKKIKPEEDE